MLKKVFRAMAESFARSSTAQAYKILHNAWTTPNRNACYVSCTIFARTYAADVIRSKHQQERLIQEPAKRPQHLHRVRFFNAKAASSRTSHALANATRTGREHFAISSCATRVFNPPRAPIIRRAIVSIRTSTSTVRCFVAPVRVSWMDRLLINRLMLRPLLIHASMVARQLQLVDAHVYRSRFYLKIPSYNF